jgi:hypothetical protein
MNEKRSFIASLAITCAALLLSLIPLTASAATPLLESARITGPNTVVVLYSEPVNTTLNDYSGFTGSLASASLASISGSGTATITLTFAGSPFTSGASGGMNIATTVTSVSDGYNFGGGPESVINGQAPLLSSISVSSNDLGGTMQGTGDTISVSFYADEQIQGVTAMIANHTVSVSGSGAGPYMANYTIESGDNQTLTPVTVSFTDLSGNPGHGSFTLGGNGNGPSVVSITSNANTPGALADGGTITFVLTLASPVPNAVVSGSYDGVPLTWTTGNGGATYSATYTVEPGNTMTATPLQISGVTVVDPSGNVSAPASGTDVEKTIDTNSFTISTAIAVPSTTTATPTFTFYSPQDGTVAYGGDCSSPVLTAIEGDNSVIFNALADGVHSNCTVTVTDEAGYASNVLSIPSFTVGGSSVVATTAPTTTTAASEAAIDSYKFVNFLGIGSTGIDVTSLQERLTAEGIYSGPITGYYGDLTAAAVKTYQGQHDLDQFGYVGPGTRAALNSDQ